MRNRGKWFTAFLLIAVILCGMMTVAAATAGNYIVSISDDIAGTTVVNKGDTVKLKVTVSGATFNGMQAAVSYDSDLFELKSVTGDAATDDSQTVGVVELYVLRNAAYANGSTVAALTFTAKAEGTGSFRVTNATVGDYEDFKTENAVPAATVSDSVTVKTDDDSHSVTKTPDAVYWGNDNVKNGSTYRFGVNSGYDAAYATPTVTMGGEPVAVAGSGTESDPWKVTGVTGDLVIKSPEHSITFQSDDSNITLPANTKAHYGQNCTFTLPSCVTATMKIGTSQPSQLTADVSGKVTIQGKYVTDDIVVTFAYHHEFATPVYQWSDDYAICRASRVCSKCKFEESESANSTYVLNSDGTKTFVAEFKNPAFTRQEIKTDFGEEIKVTFRLIGDSKHDNGTEGHDEYVTWIPTTTYAISKGDTVYDVFMKAISDHGLSQRGASGGYVSAVKAPGVLGGYWLSEYDNGPNAGWMYTVNGVHENTSMKDCLLENGDRIIWHYSDDYTQEEKASSKYYQRWLEAKDITPEKYVELYGKDEDEEGETIEFVDVKKSDWFYDEVQYAVSNGLFNGVGNDKFDPNGSMTRAMMVTVLYRLEGEPAVRGTSPFSDVSNNIWYTDAVIWAEDNAIVNGAGDNKFDPNSSITREQMAAVLFRYAQYKKYDTSASNSLSKYSDFSSISAWSLNAMKWANAEGLITGRTATTLAPKGTATRAEVAAILYRFVENVVNK